MSSAALLLVALVALVAGYRFYGGRVARWLGVDPSVPTPAHRLQDGVDYLPARRAVLLGHHFASIAGAAPIIGPVTALAFGWGPVFLWIVVGGIFMGAVHDFASLMASLRHDGKSIGEIIEARLGFVGRTLFLVFSWTTLVLVVAVFSIVVAKTFVQVPAAATASVLFIGLALAFGVAVYRLRVPLLPASIVGVVLLFGSIWAGTVWPLALSFDLWIGVLLAYVFVASVTPVNILLQPRDYLNSFLLYAMMLLGVAGVLWARPALQAPMFTSWRAENLGALFPVLFVTVACGAISGFHSLVSSGTTAKQLDSEADAQPVGYGSMLVESLLAVLALIAVAFLSHADYVSFLGKDGGGPVAAFSSGLGQLIGTLGLPAEGATSFVALAVSAFALTSLDTATRLSRFAFQELFEPRRRAEAPAASGGLGVIVRNRFFATTFSVTAAGALAWSGSWKQIWPIFGSANQLLAALALLAVSVWLAHRARRNLFVLIPMVIMYVVTLTSLVQLAWHHLLEAGGSLVLGITAVSLLAVALVLAVLAARTLLGARAAKPV
ncbi:MAG: carbon starvation protein A [Pseudomonadota bacterium]